MHKVMSTLIFLSLVVKCSRLVPPPHSIQSGCGGGSLYNVFGDKCLLYCARGYRLVNGSTDRVCLANGTWSGEDPYCQGKGSTVRKLTVATSFHKTQ